jgi:aspartyl protease family protein
MTIEPGQNGHFSVEAEVDGRHLDFLVDTGATVIALREQDAGRLGIYPAAREYTVNVATANGVVRGAPVELGLVEVGSLSVRNVAALVLPDEALGQNLLGMSFLSRVRWEHRDGRLVLEQ